MRLIDGLRKLLYFNPRPREEGDIAMCGVIVNGVNFNPRPREEGDVLASAFNMDKVISIHALVKRATILAVFYI